MSKSFWVGGAALLLLLPAASWPQQGTGGGPGPGGASGVHMGTEGATTGSGQQQGAGTRSPGVRDRAGDNDRQNFSRERVESGYRPRRRLPIRGKPDRGGPVDTQPVRQPSTRPGQPAAQPEQESPRGR